MKPTAILIHVNDVEKALAWYQEAFPEAELIQDDGFSYLVINGFSIEIVLADDKVSSGKAGSVTYWQVDDLNSAITQFDLLGAGIYRGPIHINGNEWMCQVEDPFGNLIGLRGIYVPIE